MVKNGCRGMNGDLQRSRIGLEDRGKLVLSIGPLF